MGQDAKEMSLSMCDKYTPAILLASDVRSKILCPASTSPRPLIHGPDTSFLICIWSVWDFHPRTSGGELGEAGMSHGCRERMSQEADTEQAS